LQGVNKDNFQWQLNWSKRVGNPFINRLKSLSQWPWASGQTLLLSPAIQNQQQQAVL